MRYRAALRSEPDRQCRIAADYRRERETLQLQFLSRNQKIIGDEYGSAKPSRRRVRALISEIVNFTQCCKNADLLTV
jgi:hypothetical protein